MKLNKLKKQNLVNSAPRIFFIAVAVLLALILFQGCAKKEIKKAENISTFIPSEVREVRPVISESKTANVSQPKSACPNLTLPSYREVDLRTNGSIWLKYEYTNDIKFSNNYQLSVPVQLNCSEHSTLYSCPEFKLTGVGIANVSVTQNVTFLKINLTFSLYDFRNTTDPLSGIPVKKAKLKLENAQCQKFEAGKVG